MGEAYFIFFSSYFLKKFIETSLNMSKGIAYIFMSFRSITMNLDNNMQVDEQGYI